MTRKQLVDALILSMDEEPQKWVARERMCDDVCGHPLTLVAFRIENDCRERVAAYVSTGKWLATIRDIGRQPGPFARFRLNRAVHRLARRKIAEKLEAA